MEIITNKSIDKNILNIVKESFEEQKNISILSIYEKDNDIYGIYINNPFESLSFVKAPLTDMHTDIDGHQIFMLELGTILHFIYKNGSTQMFNWLVYPSAIDCSNDLFRDLLSICSSNPPLDLSSFHLIKWIEKLNDGNLNMSVSDLMKMAESFMEIEPLDIDVSNQSCECIMKNHLNKIRQELMNRKYKKITEATIAKIDKLFIQMQLNLYNIDDK